MCDISSCIKSNDRGGDERDTRGTRKFFKAASVIEAGEPNYPGPIEVKNCS